MKWNILFGVCLLLFLCVFPVTADTVSDTFEDVDVFESFSSTTSSVIHGETKYFSHAVPSGSTEMNIRLAWKLPPDYNSLALHIFNPDGLAIAEFTDRYENFVPNGLIPVKVMIPANTPAGNWIFAVIGLDVADVQTFTLQGQALQTGIKTPTPPHGETEIYTVQYVDRGLFAPQITARMSAWFTYDGVNAPEAHFVDLVGIAHNGDYYCDEYYFTNQDNETGQTTITGIITARKVSNPETWFVYTLKIFCSKYGDLASSEMKKNP